MKSILGFTALFVLLTAAQAMDVGVRIRFGLTDESPTRWDGTATVQPGRITSISGWRFADGDRIQGSNGWTAATRRTAPRRRTNNPRAAERSGRNRTGSGPMADNGAILFLAEAQETSRVEVKTAKGNFSFRLSDIPYGQILEELNGAVEIERCAASDPLTSQRTDDDFPAAASGANGVVYVAYISFAPGVDRDERARQWESEPKDLAFLSQPAKGDQVWLRVFAHEQWSEPIPVTAGQGDIYKCAVAVDNQERVWIFWSEQKSGNFDIWARWWKAGRFSTPEQLTTDSGSDHSPVAAADANGRIWLAWQGARGNTYRILARRQQAQGKGWTDERTVSSQRGNCWAPAIAASGARDQKRGGVVIAWDTYDKGDYDVWLREFALSGEAASPQPVANSARYEARASVAYDREGRLWVAWEESGETWGKNWGALVSGPGIPLYRDRQIGLRVLRDGKEWLQTPDRFIDSLPGVRPRRRIPALRVPALEPESETRRAAREAETRAAVPYNNLSRLISDMDGRLWLLVRTRANDFRSSLGSVWMEYASYYEGEKWVGPILIPHSDNLLYNVPAAIAPAEGGLLVVHSTDHRQDRQVQRRAGGGNASLGAMNDPFDNDIYVSRLPISRKPASLSLEESGAKPEAHSSPSASTIKEREEVARCRAYRTQVQGKQLRILRGEFHRHTEISGDGGNDGPLEDMWRYAIDVALMDWIGSGDHDNGAGREYPWWLTQKTTDAFHLPGAFDPMFTYERSVRYPEGHRNVVFAQRGIRTLPRLPITTREFQSQAPDTQMLYKYLRLFDGLCAVHTSATGMGTDWRDNDPEVEPMVEIYQGCRQNYERPGAPRSPTENDAIGGWEPKGFVNLALLKGYRLAFQSSSDHRSTHISYALVYAEEPSREAILAAMKARHIYAATDNIIADYRCVAAGKEHFMGEEFSASEPPTLKVKLIGTAPFAKVVIVKDDTEVHTLTPDQAEVSFSWTDPKPNPGKTSYYYVRGEQKDGELVWASPIWLAYQGN